MEAMRPPTGPRDEWGFVIRTRLCTGVRILAPGLTWTRWLAGLPCPGGGPFGAASAEVLYAVPSKNSDITAAAVFLTKLSDEYFMAAHSFRYAIPIIII